MHSRENQLHALFQAALARAQAATCLPAHLPPLPDGGRMIVLAAGKAAAAMAKVAEQAYGERISGLAVTRYGHGLPLDHLELVEAAHPVPDQAGRQAAARILSLIQGLSAQDHVLFLLSGGASALLALPASGIALEDKQAVTKALLASGASIGEMNAVRKHLSAIKGGWLAAQAWPARVTTLAISDVAGDDLSTIGSGPTVPDPTDLAQARAVLARYGIVPSPAIAAHLADPAHETPKPGDTRLALANAKIIATAHDSLMAAADHAASLGLTPVVLGDRIEGEARDVARALGGIALAAHVNGVPARPPMVLLSGGETSVTLRGTGRGGRNTEFLLSLAIALDGCPGIWAMACDTDGIDGSENNAGAIISPDSLTRAAALGLSPRAYLDNNDAWGFFDKLGDLIITGPSLTNINDFRAILVSG